MSYTCQTCSTVSDDIGKHLSSTRHKTVSYDSLQEIVECEECGDSNIHILSMLRYGLSDLSLLCSLCYSKSSSPATAEYTLSNGTLLSKLPQYFTFRDISCEKCNTDDDLYVGKIKGKQHIMCKACIDSGSMPVSSFVSENSEDFLFALLGIKEYIAKPNSKSKGRKRTVGRKGGRKSEPKVLDAEAERRKAHYENSKATRNALKSGKTIKAVGSGTQSPSFSRSSTPLPQTKPSSKGGSSSAKVAPKSSGSKAPQRGAKAKAEMLKMAPSSTQSNSNSKPSNPASTKKSVDPKVSQEQNQPQKPQNVTKSRGEKKEQKKWPDKKQDQKKDQKKDQKSHEATSNAAKSAPKNSANSSSKEHESKKAPKKQGNKTTSSDFKPERAEQTKTNTSKTEIPSQIKNQDKNEKSQLPPVKYPPGISKYEPSATPKLSYDSINEYFNEMCYNLFLEEKISLNTSPKALLTCEDFDLEWYAEQNRKNKQFKLSMTLDAEFLDRFQQKKMQSLKKKPFNVGQSVILMLGDDIPWYGNVVYAETELPGKKSGKGGKFKGRKGPRKPNGPEVLELIVELYDWNNMPLPTSCDVRLLRVLPVSVPVSRVFTAMSRISNPRFIDLLLGKKPVRQIFFKNYLKFSRDTFNESQKVAMQSVMNNSITVLQGPPGTGKTSTIYEIILQLLDNLNTYPILVVAASNIAIDNIAEKLLPKHGNSILRIVSAEKEAEYNKDHPLSSICLHHKVFDGLPGNLQDMFREMRRPNSKISPNQFKKLMTHQISYSDKIIASSRVIFTTTVVAGGNQLKSIPKMPVVIMDEATQSSEPTTLIPLSMNGVEKFVFVGDQRQLSSFSQVPNLSLSLFERILSNGTYNTPHMLDTQYRMHPAISKFSRLKFYDGLLKDGITAADRVKEGIPSNPLLFWDTKGSAPEGTVFSRFREDSGLTYCNRGEVNFVQKILTYLIYEKNIPRSSIGVITPYRGQRDILSSTLVKDELVNPEKDEIHIEVDREDFYNESKPVTIHSVADIMIASVDAFQGREKDFLIMSCVRSNKQNKIGFLSDARRMNVALTRARYGMILVGDVNCLKNADPLWKEYITSLEDSQSIYAGSEFSYA